MADSTPDTEPPHENLRCVWTDGPYRCLSEATSGMVTKTRPFVCDRHEESAATFIAHARFESLRQPLEETIAHLRSEWRALQEILAKENSVVYYLQRENGDIKIGVSRHIDSRVNQLESDEGPLRLLALEYGGRTTEGIRHRQFSHLRVEGEWFTPGPALLEHCHWIIKNSPALTPMAAPILAPSSV